MNPLEIAAQGFQAASTAIERDAHYVFDAVRLAIPGRFTDEEWAAIDLLIPLHRS